jgi:hypothetical protein
MTVVKESGVLDGDGLLKFQSALRSVPWEVFPEVIDIVTRSVALKTCANGSGRI